MIVLGTTPLLTWEVSIDHAASETLFFITAISPWDQDQGIGMRKMRLFV